jgi:peptidyl-prolyl cis-trans isomerase A (cyclophilin A)
VVPNFVAQFGSGDTNKINRWMKYKIPDETVLHSNKKGAISFARAGAQTRGSDLFINLTDNSRLDTIHYAGVKGFPCFGDVINGMEVVSSLYSGYGDNTMSQLDTLYRNRDRFLKTFPQLNIIRKAYILRK